MSAENRKKKASNVASWLPGNKDFRCDYVTRVVKVKATYGLWMIQAEHDEAYRVLSKGSSQTVSSSPRSPGMLPSSGVLPSSRDTFPAIVSDQTPELNAQRAI